MNTDRWRLCMQQLPPCCYQIVAVNSTDKHQSWEVLENQPITRQIPTLSYQCFRTQDLKFCFQRFIGGSKPPIDTSVLSFISYYDILNNDVAWVFKRQPAFVSGNECLSFLAFGLRILRIDEGNNEIEWVDRVDPTSYFAIISWDPSALTTENSV